MTSFLEILLNQLAEDYWYQIYEYVSKNRNLLLSISGFLINPEKIILYIGTTHLAIEYVGSERIDQLPKEPFKVLVECIDYTQSNKPLLENIIGFEYDTTSSLIVPLPQIAQDLIVPTNRGFDKLIELDWNFHAQNSYYFMNAPVPTVPSNQFTRIINGLFFDADNGNLKTRHIKWIDFIPLKYDDSDPELDTISIDTSFYPQLVEHDSNFIYPIPEDYKFKKLPQINRFIELINDAQTAEPNITKFLSLQENKFILTMHFGAQNIFGELLCKWQNEDKPDIKPDFFILQANGYANIVEFKLPDLKSKSITGKDNRETFSAEINAYISQTRVYESFFDNPNNRKWFEDQYKIKVHKPKRILVAGRRSDFKGEEWREIQADYRNIELLTYDDLIDGVVAQFYL